MIRDEKKEGKMRKWMVVVVAICFLAGLGLGSALALDGSFADGVYEGQHAFVRVRVFVLDGEIADIEILEHGGGGARYHDMIEPLLEQIVEQQSLDVDAITGATVSSNYLKQAVRNALGI